MVDEDAQGALVCASAVQAINQQADVLESIPGSMWNPAERRRHRDLVLAGLAIREDERLGLWTGLASAAFVLVVGLCLTILRPTGTGHFGSRPASS
jgi:hypothetical protein